MENARRFFEQVVKTKEAKQLIASYKQPDSPENVIRAYAQIAAKLGINLSEEEIALYFDEKIKIYITVGELDDEEMAQFWGGVVSVCSGSYRNRENCWWNDGCDYANNEYSSYACSWSTKDACAAFNLDENSVTRSGENHRKMA